MTASGHGEPAKDVAVLGGGRFGRLALERLGGRVHSVVDRRPSPELERLCRESGARLLEQDAAPALARLLAEEPGSAWLVPTVPSHLLVDWLMLVLAKKHPRILPLEPDLLPEAPMVQSGPEGQLFASLATFRCPDDCPSPPEVCTVTGRPRGEPLNRRLAALGTPERPALVVVSRQLAPGVGGLARKDLLAARAFLENHNGPCLVATACLCHGVVHGLDFTA